MSEGFAGVSAVDEAYYCWDGDYWFHFGVCVFSFLVLVVVVVDVKLQGL